jgi:hypothetical protein
MNAPSAEDWPTMDELRETTAQMTAMAISSILHGNAPAYVIGRGMSEVDFPDVEAVEAEAKRAEIRELKTALAAERLSVSRLAMELRHLDADREECSYLKRHIARLTQSYHRLYERYESLYHECMQQTQEPQMANPNQNPQPPSTPSQPTPREKPAPQAPRTPRNP